MAINENDVTLTQVSGGDSSPAPGVYTLYYKGDSADWKVAADVTKYLVSVGINVGDTIVMRFLSAVSPLHKNNLAVVTGSDTAMVISIATLVDLA